MAAIRPVDWLELFALGHRKLGCTAVELAARLGVSPRTISRWYAGQTSPGPVSVHDLAHIVHEEDPALARRLWEPAASYLRQASLPSRPLSAVAAAPASPSALLRPPDTRASRSDLADLVVVAACDALDAAPRTIRPAILAAVRRARALGLTLDDIETALTPPPSAKRPAGAGQKPS